MLDPTNEPTEIVPATATDFRAAITILLPEDVRPFLVEAMKTEAEIVAGVETRHLAADRMLVLLAGEVFMLMFATLMGATPSARLFQRSAVFQMGMGLVQQVATMPDFPDVPGFPFTQTELRAAWETFRDAPEEPAEDGGESA